MRTVRDILRDADPIGCEPYRLERERDRLRQTVVAAAYGVTKPPSVWFRSPIAFLAALALVVFGIVAVGSQVWSPGGATLQAAMRFEVRLAEDQPAAGLREVRSAGSDRVIYLHDAIIVTNDDIAQSRLVPGEVPSRFGIEVQFTAVGAEKMRQATASHIGRPVAILIDGQVVTAPALKSAISTSALITGAYTKAEAERIMNGIGIR